MTSDIRPGRPRQDEPQRERVAPFMCQLTADQRAWLEDQSWSSRRSMNQVVRDLIDAARSKNGFAGPTIPDPATCFTHQP